MGVTNIRIVSTLLVLAMFNLSAYASSSLLIDGSTGVKPLVESLAKHYMLANPSAQIQVGTGLNPQSRITALLDKRIHIAMASHGIDLQQIKKKGLVAHKIAQMAVVIGVNHSVNIQGISHSTLCQIYALETTNWRVLGVSDLTIKPFMRPHNEVDAEVVSANIPCFANLQNTIVIPTMEKSGQMAKALSEVAGAIGMTTLVRVSQSMGAIRALSIEGAVPSTANLVSGVYPLTRDSYLITASSPSHTVADFLAYVRSDEGAQVIISNNAVPSI